MNQFLADLFYSFHRLRRSPGYTTIAVITLASGIAINTTMFSVVNGVLFKPIQIPELDRLVMVSEVYSPTAQVLLELPERDFEALVSHPQQPFDRFVQTDPVVGVLSHGVHAKVVTGELVTGNYFQVFNVSPRAGRLLHSADDVRSAADTPLVVSERLWRRWFGADPTVLGRPIRMAGQPMTLVGIVPEWFAGTWLPSIMTVDVWIPLHAASQVRTVRGRGGATGHRTFATLRADVRLDDADRFVRTVGHTQRTRGSGYELTAVPGHRGIVMQEFRRAGLGLGFGVIALSGLVFVIACVNLTNLALARGLARSHELAVRAALGATSTQIGRLVVAETGLIAVLGGGLGLGITFVLARALAMMEVPALDGLTFTLDLWPDLRVFGYLLGIATLAAIGISRIPARRASRREPFPVLTTGHRSGLGSPRTRRAASTLVVAQVAMSTLLVIVAGLYARSALKAIAAHPLYDVDRCLTAVVDLSMQNVAEERGPSVLDELVRGAAALPGVDVAALTSALPGFGRGPRAYVTPAVRAREERSRLSVGYTRVTAGAFRALGISVLRGRSFDARDTTHGERVAVVSEALAQKLWPDGDPIGRVVNITPLGMTSVIVGVVANAVSEDSATPEPEYLYLPLSQQYTARVSLIMRTLGPPLASLRSIEQALPVLVPGVAIGELKMLSDATGLRSLPFRVAAIALWILGCAGCAIASMGTYGLMANAVVGRSREFGIRLALGAKPREIWQMVLRQGLIVVSLGIGAGVIVALAIGGILRDLLFGVGPRDWVTFVVVPTLLFVSGMAACFWPARRAALVDPSIPLRD